MSLKAALKAGLGALEENNNFQKKTDSDASVSPETLRPSLMQKGQNGAVCHGFAGLAISCSR